MRVLIDTRIFLWLQSAPDRLGTRLSILEDPGTEILLSAATSWEISIKWARANCRCLTPGAVGSGPHAAHCRHSATGHPRSRIGRGASTQPSQRSLDRLLIAQAIAERSVLMTADQVFSSYDIDLITVSGPAAP